MREYTIQESASMSLCAYNLCNARHGYSPSMPCDDCRAAVVALVDGTAQGVPLPRIEAGDVEKLQDRIADRDPMEWSDRILALCEWALSAQEAK